MKIKEIEISEAMKAASGFSFVLGTMLSRIIAGPAECIDETSWDEILDVHFFSEDREMHVFKDEELRAIMFEDQEDDRCNTRVAVVDKNIPACSKYNTLTIKEYYDFDDDGQLIIRHVRPVELA